jgi:hypothetical protein
LNHSQTLEKEVYATKPFGYLKKEPILLSGNLPISSKEMNQLEHWNPISSKAENMMEKRSEASCLGF